MFLPLKRVLTASEIGPSTRRIIRLMKTLSPKSRAALERMLYRTTARTTTKSVPRLLASGRDTHVPCKCPVAALRASRRDNAASPVYNPRA